MPKSFLGALFGRMEPRHTGFGFFPPGTTFMPLYPGGVTIEAVPAQWVPGLMQRLYGLHEPFVAMFSAMAMRLQNISNVGPPRQAQLPGGTAHIREFDAVGAPPTNQPLRFTLMMIHGPATTAQVMLSINLFRWAELTGPFTEIVSSINLEGGPPLTSQAVAVVDPDRTDQVEINIVGPNDERIPLMAMPTVVYGTVIVNDHSVKAGEIHGTGIVVGHHSLSRVSQPD